MFVVFCLFSVFHYEQNTTTRNRSESNELIRPAPPPTTRTSSLSNNESPVLIVPPPPPVVQQLGVQTERKITPSSNTSNATNNMSASDSKQDHKATFSMQTAPQICSGEGMSPLSWVMFMGDSNMCHTYYWWTTKCFNSKGFSAQKSSTFGADRKDLVFGGRWADQGCLIKDEGIRDGSSLIRFSFRFLHGSIAEFIHDAIYWDIARQAAPEPKSEDISKMLNEMQQQGQGKVERKSEGDDKWEGRIHPSDFAIWATKHQKPIGSNSVKFDSWMSNWKKKVSPDVVVLMQGWGGVFKE